MITYQKNTLTLENGVTIMANLSSSNVFNLTEMIDELEDARLFAMAAERTENDTGITYTSEEVYKILGIEFDEKDEVPVVYGIDFE